MVVMMVVMMVVIIMIVMLVVMIMRRRMKKRNGKNSPSDLPAIPPSSLFRDRSSVSRHSGHFLLPTIPSRTSTIQSIYTFNRSFLQKVHQRATIIRFLSIIWFVQLSIFLIMTLYSVWSLSWNNCVPRFAIVCLLGAELSALNIYYCLYWVRGWWSGYPVDCYATRAPVVLKIPKNSQICANRFMKLTRCALVNAKSSRDA